jgi:hypothetical protein
LTRSFGGDGPGEVVEGAGLHLLQGRDYGEDAFGEAAAIGALEAERTASQTTAIRRARLRFSATKFDA